MRKKKYKLSWHGVNFWITENDRHWHKDVRKYWRIVDKYSLK